MDGVETGDDFAQGNDHFGGPEAVLFEGHELDEADDDVFCACEMGEAFDLVVVEAAQQNAIDFDTTEAGLLRGADAANDSGKASGDTGYALEGLLIDGIHADGDAAQAGFFEGFGQLFEQVAIGGDGEIQSIACRGAPGRKLAHHLQEVLAEEGFSAGEADFFDAQIDEGANEAKVFAGCELGVLRSNLAGAAIDTLVVAAVGDGDAQVGDDTPVAVPEMFWGRIGATLGRFDELANNRHCL